MGLQVGFSLVSYKEEVNICLNLSGEAVPPAIYHTEYYSITKKNEILLYAGRWVELGIIGLSKISQFACFFSFLVPYNFKFFAASIKNKAFLLGLP